MAALVSKGEARVSSRKDSHVFRAPNAVEVGGAGHPYIINWAGVVGATKAVVDSASLDVGPEWTEKQFPDLLAGACSNVDHAELAVPTGFRLRNVTLSGLKLHTAEGVVDINGDDMHGTRLVVSIPGLPPLYSVPAVSVRGMLPASLTGASFGNAKSGGPGVLTLPFLPGPRIRISLVNGDTPDKFETQSIDLASAPAQCYIPPRNLKLVAPDGSNAWAFPNEMPVTTPDATADFATPLEKRLNDKLKAGQALTAQFTFKGDDPSTVNVSRYRVSGALTREIEGVRSATIEGDPASLDIGGPLDAASPVSAIGDLTVKYLGIRILETVSDPLPAEGEAIGGVIVKETFVTRILRPQALSQLPVARIGLVGRAPVDCELSIQMVEMHDGAPGQPIGQPGIMKLKASDGFSTCWLQMPKADVPKVPVGISVRATKGRFFWISREQPLIRIAVYDPDPGGRAINLASSKVLDVHESQSHQPGFHFPPGIFRNPTTQQPNDPATLLWESDLFLKVDVSDLTLRYPR